MERMIRRAIETSRSEQGVALPLAMIMLVTLTALMVAFSVLASSEPTIATNHQRSAQARALADSGIQRAAWALSNPTNADGIPTMAVNTTAGAPYNGNSPVSLGTLGAFTVQVRYDALNLPTERTVTAVGWLPTKDGANLNPHRKIQVVLQQGIVRYLDPPCALCVAGNIQVSGSSTIDSRQNGCGGGTPPAAGAMYTGQPPPVGPDPVAGGGKVYGYGDNVQNGPTDIVGGAPTATVFKYTADELAKWKSIAQQNGTYYQGAVTSIPASGVIFIDTTTGADYTSSTPDSQAGRLDLSGDGTFNGIVIVAGSINLSGSKTFNGLVYALNDSSILGRVTINGALVSENRQDTSSTNIDSLDGGTTTINYNCDYVRNGGAPGSEQLSNKWVVKNSTYFEVAGN
jgi:hypothetical protein